VGALRPALRAYIIAVMAVATSAAMIAAVDWHSPTQQTLVAGALLFVMAAVAQVWPLHLSTKVKITVDDLPTFAAALMLAPLDARGRAGPRADPQRDPRARGPHRPARSVHARPLAARGRARRTSGAPPAPRGDAGRARARRRARARHRQDRDERPRPVEGGAA